MEISVGFPQAFPRHLTPPYEVDDNLLVPCIGREAQDNRAYNRVGVERVLHLPRMGCAPLDIAIRSINVCCMFIYAA